MVLALHANSVTRTVQRPLVASSIFITLVPAQLCWRCLYHQAHERGVKLIGANLPLRHQRA